MIASEIKLDNVTDERMKKGDERKNLKKEIKKAFEERYQAPPQAAAKGTDKQSHVSFFFKKLRF